MIKSPSEVNFIKPGLVDDESLAFFSKMIVNDVVGINSIINGQVP